MNNKISYEDLVHGKITIEDPEILALIETSVLKRLRYIKQQGNTFFIHSKATHNRLEHSLGVHNLATKFISKFQNEFTNYEKKLLLISALLHDIGHGPFSHCFEGISNHSHHEWTIKLIKESDEIKNILNRISGLFDDVIEVLSYTGKFKVIEKILFGPLGLDQLDFWNRDLIHSDLKLNQMDLNSLLNQMIIWNHEVVIDENGINHIEQMTLIKNSLFHSGFGNPGVIGKDILLKVILSELKSRNHIRSKLLQEVLINPIENTSIESYLALTDEVLLKEMKEAKDFENGDKYLQDLIKLYLSEKQSLPYSLDKVELSSNEESIISYIQHNKGYYAYQSNVLLKTNTNVRDAKEISDHLLESSLLPKVEYYFTLPTPVKLCN
ncbi:HD domain-containing protein [Gottfriedia acidiceleris]|uniref:HD domain-containing protein n=1 Tax=Gottfriedia acidiceleris TaxID=371036 RepID=UPI001431B842|nr:HD domain-containing protein [Gottfriedia acidiceleris]